MAVWVTEYGQATLYRTPATFQSPLAAYSLSSLSTAPFPSAGCRYVRLSADAGSLVNLMSTSTGLSLTSTNAARLPANAAPEIFGVSTDRRITVQST